MTRFAILDAELSLTGARDIVTVDISMFEDTDELLLTLPDFPEPDLDLEQTFLDLTSHPTGAFDIGPTDSISFDNASPALSGYGDAAAHFSIGLLTEIDRSSITAVRFRIYATDEVDVVFAGLRAISADWVYPPIDFDSLWNRWERSPSPDGDPNYAVEFPETALDGMPQYFPIIFRADEVAGERDPRPINSNLSSYFTTGLYDGDNTIAWYFREIPVDVQTMLELNQKNQAELAAAGHQPDFGEAVFTSRRQEDLDILEQDELDENTMFDLETQPDYTTHSWLEIRLEWTTIGTTLHIRDADLEGYEFTLPILDPADENDLDEGNYIALLDVEDNSVRFRLYGANQVGEFDKANLVFDTGAIVDDVIFKRRKGRLGWHAHFSQGDAALHNVKQRDMNFGEAVTTGFESITPVRGAQLFAGNTHRIQLFTDLWASPWGVNTIHTDPSASATGRAKKITAKAGNSLQGVGTNYFTLDNFRYTEISFRVKYPADALLAPGAGLDVFLYGEYGRVIPLSYTPIIGDKWQTIRAVLPDALIQTGTYQLVMVQTLPNKDTTWYLEDLSISTTAVLWSARSKRPDPWGMEGDQWIDFGSLVDTPNGGVVFEERGTTLQVKGKALRQSAVIEDFKVVPLYAQLGRFVWEDEVPDQGSPPTADIDSSIDDLTVSLIASSSADPDGFVVAHYWSFGDDTYDFGESVSHTYERSGDYTITLTVVDSMGNSDSASESVTVT